MNVSVLLIEPSTGVRTLWDIFLENKEFGFENFQAAEL